MKNVISHTCTKFSDSLMVVTYCAVTRVSKTKVQKNVHGPLFLEIHKKVGLQTMGIFYSLEQIVFVDLLNFKEPIDNFLAEIIL
jgi:hypothetical protein